MILAQGAQHIGPDRLRAIVNTINSEYKRPYSTTPKMIATRNYIADKYNIKDFRNNPDGLLLYCDQRYVVEEKIDGYSYINDNGRFFSKRLSAAKGNEGQPIEKTGHIPHIAKVLYNASMSCMGGFDVHGEIYVPGGVSDDVTCILGCNEDEAVRRIHNDYDNRPRYMLIDVRRMGMNIVIHEPYYVRRAILEYIYNTYIVPADKENNVSIASILVGDPTAEFKRIVRSGGEGIIIKDTSALYVPGKKPVGNWIKGKKKITLDVIITGFNDGTGKNKQLFGSFEFGLWDVSKGKVVPCGNCSSGLNDETRNKIAANPEAFIGTVMEIEAIQESANSFRNAVFLRLRDDKGPEECIRGNIRVKDTLW